MDKPGEFPYRREIYPEMYRQRTCTMRQYSGFGGPKETNQRFKEVIKGGGTGLSMAFDLPTPKSQNKSIAVIANDPSGAQGRGAILADRLRMPMDQPAEKCLIRSIPVNDASLGISKEVSSMATLLSKEYDLVVVETLSLGQHQYLEAECADLSIAVVAPGTGDHWQLRKSAILDVCDHIFMTKSDVPNFDVFKNDVIEVLHDKRKDKMPEIISVSQKDKESILTAFNSIF